MPPKKGYKMKCKQCKTLLKGKPCTHCGRRTVMTEKVKARIIEALKLGMPVVKAAKYAGINPDTYYEHVKKDPAFSEETTTAFFYVNKIARDSLVRHMPDNPNLALAYLERKEKDEFSLKQTIEHEGTLQLDFSAEAKKRLGKYE